MVKLIALDDGHGMETAGKRTPYIQQIGRFIRENEFNRAVVALLDKELCRHGFKTLLVAPTDADTPLTERTNKANIAKADIYVSVHYNALTGTFAKGGRGIETFVYKGSKDSERLGRLIHNQLIKNTPQVNRGVKEGNHLWVIRKTNMPSVLVECGFMDNSEEALLMINPEFQKECAVEICKGICEYYGVAYKEEKSKVEPVEIAIEKPSEDKGGKKLELNQRERTEVANLFSMAENRGVFTSREHVDLVMNGEMTESKAIYLLAAIIKRVYFPDDKK